MKSILRHFVKAFVLVAVPFAFLFALATAIGLMFSIVRSLSSPDTFADAFGAAMSFAPLWVFTTIISLVMFINYMEYFEQNKTAS